MKNQKKGIKLYHKKPIPKALRDHVWREYCGRNFDSHCYCCHKKISVQDWECGHIIAEANGGKTIIENLRPICSTCNKSMGTTDMDEFKKLFSKSDSYCCIS